MVRTEQKKIRVYHRLSFKQAKWTVFIAFLLSIFFSLLQIYANYTDEIQSLDTTVNQVLRIAEQPAAQAAYSLDKGYAIEVVMGIFEYDAIFNAAIYDDLGSELASFKSGTERGQYRWLTNLFFDTSKFYRISLNIQPPPTSLLEMKNVIRVGEIRVQVDTYRIGIQFLNRAVWIFVSDILSGFILAMFLLVFFHFYLTRPFIKLKSDLQEIDPEKPEKKRITCPHSHLNDEFGAMIFSANILLETIENAISMRIERIRETERLKGEISERQRTEKELRNYQEQLEQTNTELRQIVEDLQQTQEQLILSEKMAALGGLVAGIAHEINTPIGVGVTTASFLRGETIKIIKDYRENNLSQEEFEEFLRNSDEATSMILTNLQRGSDLIKSFKQVAVDQTKEEKRIFNVREYIEEVMISLQANLKRTKHTIQIHCKEDIEINSYPGALAQIITNLVFNALTHAFGEEEEGKITINVVVENEYLFFDFTDNGKGISPENLLKIFDPFFTTARQNGGTGLGLHIIYNIVTQKLLGSISCESELEKGTTFHIRFFVEK